MQPRLFPSILAGWVLAALILCLVLAPNIVGLRFPDPDDAMRLLEVRDWIGGQSWWDVGQHRLNGGVFPMHWSRLVDLPLALALPILDPFMAAATADRVAMTVVPLATLLALMTGIAFLTRRVAGTAPAQLSVLLTALSIPILYQIRPMRIDHHGWQIVFAVLAMLALVRPPTVRAGAVAGLMLATLVTISFEGFPIAVALVAVAALAWGIDPARRAMLVAMAWSLALGAGTLHVLTRGPAMFAPACDAIAPAWLALLGLAAIALTLATLLSRRSLIVRLAALVVGGVACLPVVPLLAPACLAGPFATLPPLVYRLWYLQITEGLPIWEQLPDWAALTVALPIVGLVGSTMALRRAAPADRANWTILTGALAVAFLISLFVNRAGGTANALALPGAAWLLETLFQRTRTIRSAPLRALATAGSLLLVTPGIVAGAIFAMARPSATIVSAAPSSATGPVACDSVNDLQALTMLPPGRLFAPIDATPAILATSRHQGIAGGYHRNAAAMERVLATFLGSPDAARRSVRETGATYVVGCAGLNETMLYKKEAPNGFWARLERGERFDWLQPVRIPGSPALVWRVIDSSREPLSRTPHRS